MPAKKNLPEWEITAYDGTGVRRIIGTFHHASELGVKSWVRKIWNCRTHPGFAEGRKFFVGTFPPPLSATCKVFRQQREAKKAGTQSHLETLESQKSLAFPSRSTHLEALS